MLDINLCSIKLHELCEFHQNKNICRITLISLFVKLNILNCFPSADITLQECSQINKTVPITPRQCGAKFRSEEGLDLMGWGGGSGFIETTTLNFTSRLLFDLLLTYRLKDVVSLVLFHKCFQCIYCFIKRFFDSVLSV